MSNEIRVQESLQINNPNGNINYMPRDTQFQANMSGTRGPVPGCVIADNVDGVNVSLEGLTTLGGMCRFKNKDLTNFVTWGIRIGQQFTPIGELLPGEFGRLRLSRYLGQQFNPWDNVMATGGFLCFIADTAPVEVLVEAFDP